MMMRPPDLLSHFASTQMLRACPFAARAARCLQVVPFFFFSSGTWRVIAALISMGLMAGIHLVGNFGFFNVLTAVLCIPLLDGNAALFGSEEGLWAEATAHGLGALALHALLLFLLLLAVIYAPFNSWCTQSFMHWPGLSIPRHWLGDFLRAVSPWHLVHACVK